MILLQEGEALAGSNCDLALAWFELTGQDLKERRLAGAVSADQAVAVPFGEFDIDIFEQGLLSHT